MSELIESYDSYSDFSRDRYFLIVFGILGSEISLEVPIDSTKENLNLVLKELDLDSNNFELLFKNWKTEDSNNADFSKDFPQQLLFKSKDKKCLIWVSIDDDTLFVEFKYNCNDPKLEELIIQLNHKIRGKFGLSRSPTFNVLTKSHGDFNTKEIRSEEHNLIISENYNDDFNETSEIIYRSIEEKKSGIILLYGEPGTGKTTYIKHLISKYQESNFIFIQNEFVNNLLDPEFISFLLRQRNSILVIEDAEKVIVSRDKLQAGSVVSTLLQLTDGLFSDFLNIKVICTFNTSISKIDSALLRKGRMVAMYEFKTLSVDKTNKLLSKIGAAEVKHELSVADIYNNYQKAFYDPGQKKIGF